MANFAGPLLENMASVWDDMSICPAQVCQAFYVLGGIITFTCAMLPSSAPQLMTGYGARSSFTQGTPASASGQTQKKEDRQGHKDWFDGFVTWITSIGQIPHAWFMYFYVTSVACSLFWATQYILHGPTIDIIARNQAVCAHSSMTTNQVVIAWLLMAVQGTRRLYECLFIFRPSASRMWFIHLLLGLGFYMCTSVAVWVEGSKSIWYADRSSLDIDGLHWKTVTGVAMFLWASIMQFRSHKYLCSLKKYTLPEAGLFKYLACPHYFCECVIYLSLAIMTAPKTQLFNKTMISATFFVAVNLGVTAHGTKEWYSSKFGREKVKAKWRMVPFIF